MATLYDKSVHKSQGDRFPRISAEHSGRERVQGYVYFYRFSQALSSVQSLFRRVLPSYRELLAVREYNALVRRQNVTRTLLVNRGVPPPDRGLQFQETNKPDIFDDSIMQVSLRFPGMFCAFDLRVILHYSPT